MIQRPAKLSASSGKTSRRRVLGGVAFAAVMLGTSVLLARRLTTLDVLSRAFRDLLGIAHQRLVADSDEAWFMVAGRAIRLVEPVVAGR